MPIGQVYGGGARRSPFGANLRRRSTDFMGGDAPAAPRAAAPMTGSPFLGGGARPTTAPTAAGASTWDPDNPFAQSPDIRSGVKFALANSGGAFGPNYLRDLLRKQAMQRFRNQRRRGDVLGRLVGLDRMGQQNAMLEDERAASGNLTSALNEADIAGGRGYQDLLMRLLGMEFGQETGLANAREQRRWEDEQSGGIGGFLGQALGTGIGAFTGGYGEERGRRAGR